MNKLIGLDLGKNIGVAIAIENIALPIFCTRSIQEVAKYIIEQKPEMIIIGLPLLLNGQEGEQCKKTRNKFNEISKLIPSIPFKFQDERFSSKFHAKMYNEDAHSAAWILQNFINIQKN